MSGALEEDRTMMRSVITILALALVGALVSLSSTSQTDAQEADAPDLTETVEMTVTGLSCPFCAFGLEKKLTEIEGIEEIEIEAPTGLVRFELAEGHELTEETLRSKVRDAGFEVEEILRAPWVSEPA